MKIKLSILICTLPNRDAEIIKELHRQAEGEPVEILYLGDNKKRTVGQKRNDLLRLAQGEYVVFVDDDDEVSKGYVKEILQALGPNPDCVSFGVVIRENFNKGKPVKFGTAYDDADMGTHYQRAINHLMPVKRSIALKVMFPEKSFAEDADYAIRLKPLLVTEVKITRTLYWYNYSDHGTETRSA